MNMNKFWQSKLAIAMACAFFGTVLAQGSVSEASTLYPGMGKKPASSWHKADTSSKARPLLRKRPAAGREIMLAVLRILVILQGKALLEKPPAAGSSKMKAPA